MEAQFAEMPEEGHHLLVSQLMDSGEDRHRDAAERASQISGMSKKIKNMAKSQGVHRVQDGQRKSEKPKKSGDASRFRLKTEPQSDARSHRQAQSEIPKVPGLSNVDGGAKWEPEGFVTNWGDDSHDSREMSPPKQSEAKSQRPSDLAPQEASESQHGLVEVQNSQKFPEPIPDYGNPLELERIRSKEFWDGIAGRPSVQGLESDRVQVMKDLGRAKPKPKQDQQSSQKGSTRPEKRQIQRGDKGRTLITKTPRKSVQSTAQNSNHDQSRAPSAFNLTNPAQGPIPKTPKRQPNQILTDDAHRPTKTPQSPRDPALEQAIQSAKNKNIEQSLRNRNKMTKANGALIPKSCSEMEGGLQSLLAAAKANNFSNEPILAGENRS